MAEAIRVKLDYRKIEDMVKLAGRLLALPAVHHTKFCAYLIDLGLMKNGLFGRICFWIIKKCYGSTKPFWDIVESRTEGTCRQIITATAIHVVSGKDKTTTDAAGGFNQKEVDLICVALQDLEGK